MIEVFSPGEVIFFGEHSVVYGKRGLAAAISRGVTARGVLREDGRGILRSKKFGELSCVIRGGKSDSVRAASPQMNALSFLPAMAAEAFPKMAGFDIEIESDIPEQSGLASSAAVTSAVWTLFAALSGRRLSAAETVEQVYKGELAIQKRGSVIGSACTVNGGFIGLEEGKWRVLERPSRLPRIAVIDSGQRCATSITTQIVHEHLQRDKKGTEALFEKMGAIAKKGSESLCRADWPAMGAAMDENQACLRELGVSTEKIDSILKSIGPHAHGAKITGAGGGGCIVALPKDGASEALEKAARDADAALLPAQLRLEGVEIREAQSCRH